MVRQSTLKAYSMSMHLIERRWYVSWCNSKKRREVETRKTLMEVVKKGLKKLHNCCRQP